MNKILSAAIVSAILISTQASAENTTVDTTSNKDSSSFITAQSSRVGAIISLGGTVIPQKEVNLVAKMPGDVIFIAGQEGDRFNKGDRLAAQDIDAMLAKRAQAEAQLASADAGIRNARVQLRNEIENPNSQSNAMMGGLPSMMGMFSDPIRNMSGRGDSSSQRNTNVYGMNIQVETAQNAYEQAAAAIRELDENIDNATILAPFDGMILRKMVEIGQPAQPGVPLFLFGDTSRLQIRAEVPARLVRGLHKGMKLRARLDQNSEITTITVNRIFPMADQRGHTVTVKFDVADSKAAPGMYTEVMIPDPSASSSNLVTVPRSAIVWRGSLPALFVLNNKNKISMRLVRVGEQADNGWVSILSGVKTGDQVMVTPSSSTTSSK
ncbi:MAG: efflux RND transporter periplasmic adaptor subunit [Thiotrichales bacterium]|jgi:multidrug efflux pump subunit AcrA (membrane-fusion protein)|nr:efflux RND transporter periplasmic adaptor subunit [Thiotrichales bacterium]MBT3612982.1 efflux RND transporter periplasmic adaptor subunit [Thiotrichales bacterium]MBT3752664.1 efflux RND transporter periplasmic adaptor subunit [Thiotrichales bacterium]MBT4152239.1 efflux RND transporter periplasmic adaptor subunit [Thiotrichales bacterium]MBT4573442.1 efflux RND transporter periplasmic adaptor subunit [Thiotrichales bacterium]